MGWIMAYLKACPRCHGDLIPDEDGHVRYLCCLQCGHILSGVEETALKFALARRAKLTFPKPDLTVAQAEERNQAGHGDGGMALAS